VHPLRSEDALGASALRASVAAFKGKLAGTAARAPFDDLMERVAAPTDVTFEADTVGGISGFWAKPARPHKGAAILHVHGGWFNLGTAHAYRNFVGHIASSAGADAFIPDYRLAPEHPFPAAVTDVEACYRGLVDKGIDNIAVVGDSAGGNLALVLVSTDMAPVGAVNKIWERTGWKKDEVDLYELNEAFSVQALGVIYCSRAVAAALFRRP